VNEALKTDLLAMAELDNRVRAELVSTGALFDGYNARMAEVHQQNAGKLERIIDEFGWPGASLVGDDGAEAAWLVLQHAIGNPELQRRCLPLLRAVVETEEIPAYQVACLEDRICVFEGRPQRDGTQFDWDESGMMSPHPLQDPARVDDHRQSVGLGPLSEKTAEMRTRAAAEGHKCPRDLQKRQREKDDWARSVGWR
jgi:hypothetical protein